MTTHSHLICGKAALKTPHSKRSAKSGDAGRSRQRLECGGFSAAFEPLPSTR